MLVSKGTTDMKRASHSEIGDAGTTSMRAVPDELTRRDVLTARGGAWHPTSVARLLDRTTLVVLALGAPAPNSGQLRKGSASEPQDHFTS
jgi:hypothetical protein